MTRVMGWLGGRGHADGNSSVVIQIAREVVERKRSIQGALNEVRHPAVLDALSDEDFRLLDEAAEQSATDYREYAIVLARLTHAAARAKGFDRQIVDSAIRLDSLLPGDDPSREREQLLRDAYMIAHRAGYVRGGRVTLARLGQRSVEADDLHRARGLFQQQLEIGDESTDTATEVDSAITLGDILRREGDAIGAQSFFRRASRSGGRIEYHRGVAEALVRQIELLDAGTSLETVAALQSQALDAAQRTSDLSLQSRILLSLAETLARLGRIEDVVPLLGQGVDLAREIGDLSVESRCLNALISAERHLGRRDAVIAYQEELQQLEERLGNRQTASQLAIKLGANYLEAGRPDLAVESFDRGRALAAAVHDSAAEQRAHGGLGAAYSLLDQPAEALQHLMAALELARQARDLEYEAQWLSSIGQALWRFDQPNDALRAVTEGLAIARRIDDQELQASMLAQLGQIYAASGQGPRARECYQRALDLNKRLGNKAEQVTILTALGNVAVQGRQFQQGTTHFEQALGLASELGDRATAAKLHGKLGRIAQSQRDPAAAVDHYKRAVHFAETVDRPALLEQAVLHLATAQHSVNDPSAAATYRRALGLAQQHGDIRREALVRLNLGILMTNDGQRDEGLGHLYRAADLAARIGPDADEFAERIDDAIAAAGGAPARPGDTSMDDEGDDRRVVARDNRRLVNDELFAESTLPPQ